MSRFLSTIPTNHGFVNLGLVESYPTGGSGPVAFGPTSYFGSDPRPPENGDNLYDAIDLGNFNPLSQLVWVCICRWRDDIYKNL